VESTRTGSRRSNNTASNTPAINTSTFAPTKTALKFCAKTALSPTKMPMSPFTRDSLRYTASLRWRATLRQSRTIPSNTRSNTRSRKSSRWTHARYSTESSTSIFTGRSPIKSRTRKPEVNRWKTLLQKNSSRFWRRRASTGCRRRSSINTFSFWTPCSTRSHKRSDGHHSYNNITIPIEFIFFSSETAPA